MLLEVKDMSVFYGAIQALHGISFGVAEREIVTLIGANGAGKSTTLRAISGLLRPKTGQIAYDGRDLVRVPAHKIVRLGIGQCPEGRRVFDILTVRENLEMGAYTRRDPKEIAESLEKVFTHFPRLRERAKQPASTLSGGEQQMLAVARALMSRPRLLLLDEPSLGLAPQVVERIFAVLRDVSATGVSLLLVEQNAHKALRLAHRAYVLETGNVVMTGTGQELLASPEVRKAYLGE